MEEFLKWVRNRFVFGGLFHLSDIEDESLNKLMFINGYSRDEFIKFLVYKLLLDIDSETDNVPNPSLEKILVTFGLLDKEIAEKFLKGDMSTKLHLATWKRILNALIPTQTISCQLPSYDELMNNVFMKNEFFRSFETKNYLPPELMTKKVQDTSNDNCNDVGNILNELITIIKKPIGPNENNEYEKTPSNCESRCSSPLEFIDLNEFQKDIENYTKLSNENKIVISKNEQIQKLSSQKCIELIKNQNLIDSDHIESKVNSVHQLWKAEQDLQLLVNSLRNQ